jgi:hypothetical protein
MIRKIQIFGLAFAAICAFGAMMASMASAETTLIALWLNNGVAVAANLPSETLGTLLLEDKVVGAAVECEGALDGTVGVNGVDSITAVLNINKEEISKVPLSGLALMCTAEAVCEPPTAESPIEVWPVGLPWASILFLMETPATGTILDRVYGVKVGYDLLCLISKVMAEDECTGPEATFPVQNTAGDAETPGGITATPLATCTVGGANAGVDETVGVSTIKLTEEGTLLSVSSE